GQSRQRGLEGWPHISSASLRRPRHASHTRSPLRRSGTASSVPPNRKNTLASCKQARKAHELCGVSVSTASPDSNRGENITHIKFRGYCLGREVPQDNSICGGKIGGNRCSFDGLCDRERSFEVRNCACLAICRRSAIRCKKDHPRRSLLGKFERAAHRRW